MANMGYADSKQYLSKNKSIKLFREKKKKRDAYIQRREDLIKRYEQLDTANIKRFNDFPLTEETKRGLKKCGYLIPTEIQLETIGLALKGNDILGAAKTGSGKTLAFVVPILERLFCEGWCKTDGLGVLVITPTRELALQIHEVCHNIGSFHDFTVGLVIGGKDLKVERKILNLYNIVICTPGRLLQHMDQNPLFDAMNLQMLVLDEADRILDLGFQKEMNAIIENLPQKRQTLLFSATQTKSVKDLARLSLKNPIYVSVHEHAKHATPESLQQSYIVCELHKKMDFLWSFIKNHKKQKILIFMASCKQVKYTFEVFCRMKPGVSLTALYGGLHQMRRMERYKDFCRKNYVVMFATDLAARGLDFPNVNWVVQLDCPEDTNTYIHRAGRTARYQKGGESLLVLLPSEKESMIGQLEKRKIPIHEIRVHPKKILSIQRKMEAFCARDVNLKESAQRAFKSYYKSVFLMKDKSIFNISYLDQDEVREAYAKSLGLAFAPRIRFIEKHLKPIVGQDQSPDEVNSEESTFSSKNSSVVQRGRSNEEFNFDDDSEDEFLKPKLKSREFTHSVSDSEEEVEAAEEADVEISSKKKKPLTKAALAKKIRKKNIKANVKVVFNEDGEPVEDTPRTFKAETANKLAKEMAEEGYNLEKAMLIMNEEDEMDKAFFHERLKQKHKEKRLKLKKQRREAQKGAPELGTSGGDNMDEQRDDDDDGTSASDVDPNDFMGSGSSDDNDDSDGDHGSEEEEESRSEEESNFEETRKRRLTAQGTNSDMEVPKKKRKNRDLSDISLADEEVLALHLLTNS